MCPEYIGEIADLHTDPAGNSTDVTKSWAVLRLTLGLSTQWTSSKFGRDESDEEDCSGCDHVGLRRDFDERRSSGREEEGRTRQVRYDEVLRQEDQGLQEQVKFRRTGADTAPVRFRPR